MNKKDVKYGLVATFLLIIVAGFLAPIGSFTSQNSCLADETSRVIKKKLTLIKGETLSKAKASDTSSNGCTLPVKYTLYVL